MIKAAILGYGTVGGGVAEVLMRNASLIEARAGERIELKYILDLREFPGDVNEDKVVHDFDIILNDPEIEVICETMGGKEPAYTFSKKALMAGKSVCTSNKELVAACGPELIALAEENDCRYLFEASVGGGIPIIRTLSDALCAEKVLEIKAILNGTTNYILTRMEKDGADFSEVLKEAQEMGYAERNPEADVEGHDAGRKAAILASLICGKNVAFEDLYTEGITGISAADFAYAGQLGRTIKLLAGITNGEDGICAYVSPFMLPAEHPLHGVNDVYNAVFVTSDNLENTMYYGRGAGKLPTASAVVADLISAAVKRCGNCVWSSEKAQLADYGQTRKAFFARFKASEADEKQVMSLLGAEALIKSDAVPGEFAVVSKVMTEEDFNQTVAGLQGFGTAIRMAE